MKRIPFALVLIAVALLLGACSTFTLSDEQLQFSLVGAGDLGYEVNEDTITIETRQMRFSNAAGAPGVTLTGYTVTYYDTDGNLVNGGDSTMEGSMGLFVPPGIQCDDPHAVYGCTMLSTNAKVAPGPAVLTEQTYQLLPVAVAQRHLASGVQVGWYAEIVFDGFTVDGRSFETTPYRVAIVAPN